MRCARRVTVEGDKRNDNNNDYDDDTDNVPIYIYIYTTGVGDTLCISECIYNA